MAHSHPVKGAACEVTADPSEEWLLVLPVGQGTPGL